MLGLWRSVCKNKSRPNPTTIHQNRQTGILINFFTIELKYNFSFSPSLKSSGKGGEREEEGGREGREDRNFFYSETVFIRQQKSEFSQTAMQNSSTYFQQPAGANFFHSDEENIILLWHCLSMKTQETVTAILLVLLPAALAREEIGCSLAQQQPANCICVMFNLFASTFTQIFPHVCYCMQLIIKLLTTWQPTHLWPKSFTASCNQFDEAA